MKRSIQIVSFIMISAIICCCSALAADPIPLDGGGNGGAAGGGSIFIAILIPALIALIACSVMKARMRSTGKKNTANTYISANGINITGRMDRYTHTTETRIRLNNGNNQPRR